MRSYVSTYTGLAVDPFDFRPEDVDLLDIAHTLSCINRFGGAARVPISVAQHSVFVSRVCERLGAPRLVILQALLHDASEAYLGDIPKWLKASPQFEGYRKAEEHVQRTVFEVFGCDKELWPVVKYADRLMVRFEAEEVHPSTLLHIQQEAPAELAAHYGPTDKKEKGLLADWAPWGWNEGKARFYARAQFLANPNNETLVGPTNQMTLPGMANE